MTTATPTRRRGTGKPRGVYAKTEEKRRAILDAALEVFAQSGYRSSSVREVAERVGISETGLLHHFSNKSALLAAVLELRDDRSRDFFPLGADVRGRSTIEGILELVDYNASQPGVVELYCTLSAESTSTDHPAHQYFIERYQWSRQLMADAFTVIQAEGDLRPDVTPASAAARTIATMDGLQVQWLLEPDAIDMAAELRNFFRSVVSYEL
ncbi:transcriptional regulator, TetR family [Microbacterium sp. cf046]|uniref:TetR/AcrR family transcriptional regulator n=1 Tax=Microbacterium sp. cf046 TaxID=1761803 RepID=UPI0008E05661|nr:TetR/AcrR family transcriptional regulator [Microbacterium sp. cf046]SFS16842.1 transcriptional regulator, TetR family [Microbacterium sp. cf046]